jgi:mannose-6-phosphate isomerase-like protein (cupin superfamily)
MPSAYTLRNLAEIEDSAAKFGHDQFQEARFASGELEAERTGLSHHKVKPGKRQAFAHRHEDAEEVYVILSGSGRLKLDDDIVEVRPLDALRIAPGVTRQFEASDDGLEFLAFGAAHKGDARWSRTGGRTERPAGILLPWRTSRPNSSVRSVRSPSACEPSS